MKGTRNTKESREPNENRSGFLGVVNRNAALPPLPTVDESSLEQNALNSRANKTSPAVHNRRRSRTMPLHSPTGSDISRTEDTLAAAGGGGGGAGLGRAVALDQTPMEISISPMSIGIPISRRPIPLQSRSVSLSQPVSIPTRRGSRDNVDTELSAVKATLFSESSSLSSSAAADTGIAIMGSSINISGITPPQKGRLQKLISNSTTTSPAAGIQSNYGHLNNGIIHPSNSLEAIVPLSSSDGQQEMHKTGSLSTFDQQGQTADSKLRTPLGKRQGLESLVEDHKNHNSQSHSSSYSHSHNGVDAVLESIYSLATASADRDKDRDKERYRDKDRERDRDKDTRSDLLQPQLKALSTPGSSQKSHSNMSTPSRGAPTAVTVNSTTGPSPFNSQVESPVGATVHHSASTSAAAGSGSGGGSAAGLRNKMHHHVGIDSLFSAAGGGGEKGRDTYEEQARKRYPREGDTETAVGFNIVVNDEHRAVENDRIVQQRLMEAKALSRREEGGSVMHKFSLWNNKMSSAAAAAGGAAAAGAAGGIAAGGGAGAKDAVVIADESSAGKTGSATSSPTKAAAVAASSLSLVKAAGGSSDGSTSMPLKSEAPAATTAIAVVVAAAPSTNPFARANNPPITKALTVSNETGSITGSSTANTYNDASSASDAKTRNQSRTNQALHEALGALQVVTTAAPGVVTQYRSTTSTTSTSNKEEDDDSRGGELLSPASTISMVQATTGSSSGSSAAKATTSAAAAAIVIATEGVAPAADVTNSRSVKDVSSGSLGSTGTGSSSGVTNVMNRLDKSRRGRGGGRGGGHIQNQSQQQQRNKNHHNSDDVGVGDNKKYSSSEPVVVPVVAYPQEQQQQITGAMETETKENRVSGYRQVVGDNEEEEEYEDDYEPQDDLNGDVDQDFVEGEVLTDDEAEGEDGVGGLTRPSLASGLRSMVDDAKSLQLPGGSMSVGSDTFKDMIKKSKQQQRHKKAANNPQGEQPFVGRIDVESKEEEKKKEDEDKERSPMGDSVATEITEDSSLRVVGKGLKAAPFGSGFLGEKRSSVRSLDSFTARIPPTVSSDDDLEEILTHIENLNDNSFTGEVDDSFTGGVDDSFLTAGGLDTPAEYSVDEDWYHESYESDGGSVEEDEELRAKQQQHGLLGQALSHSGHKSGSFRLGGISKVRGYSASRASTLSSAELSLSIALAVATIAEGCEESCESSDQATAIADTIATVAAAAAAQSSLYQSQNDSVAQFSKSAPVCMNLSYSSSSSSPPPSSTVNATAEATSSSSSRALAAARSTTDSLVISSSTAAVAPAVSLHGTKNRSRSSSQTSADIKSSLYSMKIPSSPTVAEAHTGTDSANAVAMLRRKGKTSFSVGGSPLVVYKKKHGGDAGSGSGTASGSSGLESDQQYDAIVAAAALAASMVVTRAAAAAASKSTDSPAALSAEKKKLPINSSTSIRQRIVSSSSSGKYDEGEGRVSSTAVTPLGTMVIRSAVLPKAGGGSAGTGDDGHGDNYRRTSRVANMTRSASPALSEMSHDDDYDEEDGHVVDGPVEDDDYADDSVGERKGAAGTGAGVRRDKGSKADAAKATPPSSSKAKGSVEKADEKRGRSRSTNGDDDSKFIGFVSGVGADEVYQAEGCDNSVFRFRRGDVVGEGSFGRVYRSKILSTGESLAVKQIVLADGTEAEVKSLKKEIQVMWDLRHDNIVRYVGTCQTERYLLLILEYVNGGSIHTMLAEHGPFNEHAVRHFTVQVLAGIVYLHNKGIVHRDIKGANVLVTDTGTVKLADFGCSKQLAGLCTASLEESLRLIKGSVPWMAPEVIKQTGSGRSADIWSLGSTIIEMATGSPPWPQFTNNLAALFHVATSKEPPPIPVQLSPACASFLRRCMVIDAKFRATAQELSSDLFLGEEHEQALIQNGGSLPRMPSSASLSTSLNQPSSSSSSAATASGGAGGAGSGSSVGGSGGGGSGAVDFKDKDPRHSQGSPATRKVSQQTTMAGSARTAQVMINKYSSHVAIQANIVAAAAGGVGAAAAATPAYSTTATTTRSGGSNGDSSKSAGGVSNKNDIAGRTSPSPDKNANEVIRSNSSGSDSSHRPHNPDPHSTPAKTATTATTATCVATACAATASSAGSSSSLRRKLSLSGTGTPPHKGDTDVIITNTPDSSPSGSKTITATPIKSQSPSQGQESGVKTTVTTPSQSPSQGQESGVSSRLKKKVMSANEYAEC